MGIEEQRLKKLLPRHVEIMKRLCMGETQRDIAHQLGMAENRLSVIVNSPLFQVELRKMQRRMEDRVAEIYQGLVANAETTVRRHKEILNDACLTIKDVDGTELRVPVPLPTIIATSSVALNAFLKLHKGGPAELDDGDEPYEARLEKEVTFRETTTIKKPKKKLSKKEVEEFLEDGKPTEDILDIEHSDGLDCLVESGG